MVNLALILSLFFTLYVWVYCLYVCKFTMFVEGPKMLEQGIGFPWAAIIYSWMWPCWCREPILAPLKGQQAFWAIEPSLHFFTRFSWFPKPTNLVNLSKLLVTSKWHVFIDVHSTLLPKGPIAIFLRSQFTRL